MDWALDAELLGTRNGPREPISIQENSPMKNARVGTAVLIIGMAFAFAACTGSTPKGPIPRYDARTFFETTAITGASFSHDEERILISTDATGVFNAYSQPFAGGSPQQLTRSESDAIFAVSWFPNDDRFLYTADQGGNELNHLYVRENDGSVRDLTPGDRLKAMFAGWSGDRNSFWVLGSDE